MVGYHQKQAIQNQKLKISNRGKCHFYKMRQMPDPVIAAEDLSQRLRYQGLKSRKCNKMENRVNAPRAIVRE